MCDASTSVSDTIALLRFWVKVHQPKISSQQQSVERRTTFQSNCCAHSFYSYLVTWWFAVAIDTLQKSRLLRLLCLHLHHNVILIGHLFGAVHINALHINIHLQTLEQALNLSEQELTSLVCQNLHRAACPSCTGSTARCPRWPRGEGWWLWSRSSRPCYRLEEQRTKAWLCTLPIIYDHVNKSQ